MRVPAMALVLGFLLLFPCLVFGETTLTDMSFSPQAFFVGDYVELRIEVSSDRPLAVDIPEAMPETEWVEIRDIRMETSAEQTVVFIDFTPFAPGTRELPTIELGELRLEGVKVPTHSVLGSSRGSVRTLRGQLLFPGTRLAVAIVLAVIAMAPFLGFGLVRTLWKQMSQFREVWKKGRPARKLRRLLKVLRSGIGSEPPIQWYAILTEALRRYMSSRLGHDCNASTTAEIAHMSEFGDKNSPPFRLLEILQAGDMVKFAGQIADDRTLKEALEHVESAVQDWEKDRVSL